jgi:Cell Wall Hydrolase
MARALRIRILQQGNVMPSVADPIGAAGRRNLYASAGTEPLNNVDPSAGCEFLNQDQSAQPGEESGLCDESIGGLEAGIGTVAAIDAANQELTAMVDGLGRDSRAGTQFAGPGAPRTIGPSGFVPAPGDANLLARMMFTEAAGATDAYSGIGWAAVNRVNSNAFGAANNLSGVINFPLQFQGVGEHGNALWELSGRPSGLTGRNASAWASAVSTANGILRGSVGDPTGGATTFYSGAEPTGWKAAIAKGDMVYSPYSAGGFSLLH